MWRLPAEWEKHKATWMAWPNRECIWPDIDATCRAYANVVNAISEGETVNLLVDPARLTMAKKRCSHDNVNFMEAPLDDSWARDTLPLFLTQESRKAAVNWRFNAWGEKYQPYSKDSKLGKLVLNYIDTDTVFLPSIVLEGGAIHTNGDGIMLLTKSSVLNENRNTNLSQTKLENALREYVNAKEFVWLETGMLEDLDTDGHIDNVACFVSHDTVLMQGFNEGDLNASTYFQNKAVLEESFAVHTLTQPSPVFYNGERLALSYVNFYIANHAVIIPSFGEKKTDDAAKAFVSDLLTDRAVVQIDARDIVIGGGGIHCMTMQEPEVS